MGRNLRGPFFVLLCLGAVALPLASVAQQVDSLPLFSPDMFTERGFDATVTPVACFFEPPSGDFVAVNWSNIPDSISTLINQLSLAGWDNPDSAFVNGTFVINGKVIQADTVTLSIPAASGVYSGNIDRTIVVRAERNGFVGLGSPDTTKISTQFGELVDLYPGKLAPLEVSFQIVGEAENKFSGTLLLDTVTVQIQDVDSLYAGTDSAVADTIWNFIDRPNPPFTPGDLIELVFENPLDPDDIPFTLGVRVTFNEGRADSNGTYRIACQDFEGFHIWRGLTPCIDEMTAVAEFSKTKAFIGVDRDSCFFETFPSNGASFQWIDNNVFNGFTYYYAVTTYDMGFDPVSLGPTHPKVDSHFCDCDPQNPFDPANPVPCDEQSEELVYDNPPGRDSDEGLKAVYAYPNPYRDGASALTTLNYHNFPDNSVVITNVPAEALVRIYTVAGDLVWEMQHSSPISGNVRWPVSNQNGDDVSSGVYIYRIETGGGNKVDGRIVVIR